MIGAWLDMSVVGIFASLIAVYGAAAVLIAWLIFSSPLRGRVLRCGGIVAPYFTSIALLFSLLTGFLAGDVIDRFRQSVRAVQVEAGALSNLHALARASTVDAGPIRQALAAYLETLVRDEWPRMSRAQASAKADAALATLLRTVADPRIAPPTSVAAHDGLVDLGLQAATARSDRLALNAYQSDDIKWATVLILCALTQLSIGMVHLDRAAPHVAAMAVFTVAAVVTLGMIAIQEAPFDGPLTIPPTPLERVLEAVAA